MEHWIERPDCRLFVVERGSGTPVIFLHGGLADHHAVLPMTGALTDGRRVVTPDLRGSGKSHFAADLAYEQFTADLRATIAELGLSGAILVGVSSGSGIAVHFALQHPEMLAGLVVLKPVYAGGDRGYTASQTAALTGMDAVASRAATEGVGVLEHLYAALPPGIRERALEIARGFDGPSVAATSRFVAGGAQPFANSDALAALAVPTLIIRGDDDVHPAEISDLYAATVPGAEVAEVDDSEVPGTIAAFVARLAASG